MYYAFGLRDLLSVTELNKEFFQELDTFQLNFIDMVFKQIIESQMGMLTELEMHNYEVFQAFTLDRFEQTYGVDPNFMKKAG